MKFFYEVVFDARERLIVWYTLGGRYKLGLADDVPGSIQRVLRNGFAILQCEEPVGGASSAREFSAGSRKYSICVPRIG